MSSNYKNELPYFLSDTLGLVILPKTKSKNVKEDKKRIHLNLH